MRMVGLKASVQHSVEIPRPKIRQVGSYPKCEGSPQSATSTPPKIDMRRIFIERGWELLSVSLDKYRWVVSAKYRKIYVIVERSPPLNRE